MSSTFPTSKSLPSPQNWSYIDLKGEQQGPFPTEQMRLWFESGCFPPTTSVFPTGDRASEKPISSIEAISGIDTILETAPTKNGDEEPISKEWATSDNKDPPEVSKLQNNLEKQSSAMPTATPSASRVLSLHEELASVVADAQGEPTATKGNNWQRRGEHDWEDYSSTFSLQRGARGGTFSTAGFNSYWDRIGVSSDRNERQISNFADAATIQMQMRQANASRKRGENPVKMVDWKEHKLQVKKAKLQQAKAALLRDDD